MGKRIDPRKSHQKPKQKTKKQQELERERKNLRERLRYWRNKGYEIDESALPKTAQGMKNFTAKKIKKKAKYTPPITPTKKHFLEDWTPEPEKEDTAYDWVDIDDTDLGPSEDEYSEEPVNDPEEARRYIDDLMEYIEDYIVDAPAVPWVWQKIREVKDILEKLIENAKFHYGEDGLGRWLIDSGAGKMLYELVAEAILHYRQPAPHIVAVATLLNGGPLTQDQSQSLTDSGLFDYSEDGY